MRVMAIVTILFLGVGCCGQVDTSPQRTSADYASINLPERDVPAGYVGREYKDGLLLLSERAIHTAFDENCSNREGRPPCDSFSDYRWDITITDRQIVIYFYHMRLDQVFPSGEYDAGFACTATALPQWTCVSEMD